MFIAFSFSVHGQELKEIKGQVIDAVEKTPVVFAAIQFKNNKNGMIADEDGYFRLPYSYKRSRDTIQISSIGYATKEIPVAQLKDLGINEILLPPKTEVLDEVVLIGGKKKNRIRDSGLSLVQKAIGNIPKNYPTTPFAYIGYYRDYQLVENQYLNLNEAVVEVFDGGFQTDRVNHYSNQIALHQYNSNTDFPKDTALVKAYGEDGKYIKNAKISDMGGNELSILNLHNPIRNYNKVSFSFIDVLQTDFIPNHSFKVLKITYLNDTPLYEIEFRSNKEGYYIRHTANGKIYISTEDYAIHRLEYYVKDRNLPKYGLRLEYARKRAHMYLNYISFNNFFKADSSDNFDVQEVALDLDENAFFVSFTNPISETSLTNPKNFRFLYKKRKLSIDSISTAHPNILKIHLVNGTLPADEIKGEDTMKHVTYRFRNVYDIKNQKLGKKQTITANQFRELLVQEVFPVKALPQDVVFINKTQPLRNATIDNSLESDKYWINTPLKSTAE
jgi:hypothetical protein